LPSFHLQAAPCPFPGGSRLFSTRHTQVQPCHLLLESTPLVRAGCSRRGWFTCHDMRAHVLFRAKGNHPSTGWSAGVEAAHSYDRSCLPPFPALCPSATRCRTAFLCYACFADETCSAQWTICGPFPVPADTAQEDAREGRCAGGDHAHPQALLLPGRHRASVVGTVTVRVRFLLYTLHMDMKHDATDRFMSRHPHRCLYKA
jgi:hypothetical protein